MTSLNQIQVPKPCAEDWEMMNGDARRRFCAGCGCHVHDLSAMTTRSAQDLLDRSEGRICVRFQTRPDGTVLTQDAGPSPERRASWPRRFAAAVSWALALFVSGLGLPARADTLSEHAPHAISKTRPAAPGNKHAQTTVGKIAAPRPLRMPLPMYTTGMVAPPPATLSPPSRVTIGAPISPPRLGRPAAPPVKK